MKPYCITPLYHTHTHTQWEREREYTNKIPTEKEENVDQMKTEELQRILNWNWSDLEDRHGNTLQRQNCGTVKFSLVSCKSMVPYCGRSHVPGSVQAACSRCWLHTEESGAHWLRPSRWTEPRSTQPRSWAPCTHQTTGFCCTGSPTRDWGRRHSLHQY